MSASLLPERTRDPRFARTDRPRQDEVLRVADPVAIGERGDDALVEPAALAVFDVLDARLRILQFGGFEQPLEPLGVAPGQIAIDDHAEAFFERQAGAGGQRRLFLERAGHAVELQGLELRESLLHQHLDLLGSVVIVGPAHVLVVGRMPFGEGIRMSSADESRAIDWYRYSERDMPNEAHVFIRLVR